MPRCPLDVAPDATPSSARRSAVGVHHGLAFACVLAIASACTAPVGSNAAPSPPSPWMTHVAFEIDDSLDGCAIGDLDPMRDGDEIAVLTASGEAHLVYHELGIWRSERMWQAPGEMIQCAIGDADPSRPGLELVAVGMAEGRESDGGPGAAYLVHRTSGGWRGREIFRDDALLHGVAISDGGAWVVGYTNRALRLEPTGADSASAGSADSGDADASDPPAFRATAVAKLPDAGKNAIVLGDDIVIACTDGSLVRVPRELGSVTPESGADAGSDLPSASVLHRREAGRARLGRSADGSRVVCADDDGRLYVLPAPDSGPGSRSRSGDAELVHAELVHAESAKLRGAVLADLDPAVPGDEAATTGYSGRVTIAYRRAGGSGWVTRPLFADLLGFHHLAVGELDGNPGLDLAAAGLSGRLLVFGTTPASDRGTPEAAAGDGRDGSDGGVDR